MLIMRHIVWLVYQWHVQIHLDFSIDQPRSFTQATPVRPLMVNEQTVSGRVQRILPMWCNLACNKKKSSQIPPLRVMVVRWGTNPRWRFCGEYRQCSDPTGMSAQLFPEPSCALQRDTGQVRRKGVGPNGQWTRHFYPGKDNELHHGRLLADDNAIIRCFLFQFRYFL